MYECSMLNNCYDFLERCNISGPSSIVLAGFSISFDPHTLVMLAPLMTGASVLITPDNMHHDGDVLCSLLCKANVGFLTPSGWKLALTLGWKGNRHMLAIAGGEALSMELVTEMRPLVGTLLVRIFFSSSFSFLQHMLIYIISLFRMPGVLPKQQSLLPMTT